MYNARVVGSPLPRPGLNTDLDDRARHLLDMTEMFMSNQNERQVEADPEDRIRGEYVCHDAADHKNGQITIESYTKPPK